MPAKRLSHSEWEKSQAGKTVRIIDDRTGGHETREQVGKEVPVADEHQVPKGWLDARFDKIENEMSKLMDTITGQVLTSLAVTDQNIKTIYKRIERLEAREDRNDDRMREIREKYEERMRQIERTSDMRAPLLRWTEKAAFAFLGLIITVLVLMIQGKVNLTP